MGVTAVVDMPGTSPLHSSHHLRWILDPDRVIRRWVLHGISGQVNSVNAQISGSSVGRRVPDPRHLSHQNHLGIRS